MDRIASFDIEIATLIPEGETDWKTHRPLGITCAAIATPQGVWTYAAQNEESGDYTDRMTKDQCARLEDDLFMLYKDGYEIVTWNGLGFDFDILGEESASTYKCKTLALYHIDMMFHFFCSKGFPVGLDAVSKGLGLPGKPEGIKGDLAPVMWNNGEQEKVLDYVRSDARQTLQVYQLAQVSGQVEIKWTARSGRPNTWTAPKWMTVAEAMELPEPNVSWMSDPWPRSKFYEWTRFSEEED